MRTHDTSGRPYAKLSKLQAGAKVQVDGGFTCILAGAVLEVKRKHDELYIDCCGSECTCIEDLSKPSTDEHYLSGQLDEDNDTLIGVYPDVVIDHDFKQEQYI